MKKANPQIVATKREKKKQGILARIRAMPKKHRPEDVKQRISETMKQTLKAKRERQLNNVKGGTDNGLDNLP